MTPERVDALGVANVAAAAAKHMQHAERSVQDVLPMRSAADLAKWQRSVLVVCVWCMQEVGVRLAPTPAPRFRVPPLLALLRRPTWSVGY